MANHLSALKRARQARKRLARNRAARSQTKTVVKRLHHAILEKNIEAVPPALKAATASLMKLASKGILPKRRAARKIARLALQVNRVVPHKGEEAKEAMGKAP